MDLKIPHDAFVFVGDGRKALFLRNDGDEKFPYLKTERVFVDENPPSHEQGTERPDVSARDRGQAEEAPCSRRTGMSLRSNTLFALSLQRWRGLCVPARLRSWLSWRRRGPSLNCDLHSTRM